MSLKKQLNADLNSAIKEGSGEKRDTLRLLLSSIQNEEIAVRAKGKEELDDEDVVKVLQKEAKKRKESITAYKEGGRDELVKKEEDELKVISSYLPEELSEEEIKKIVQSTIEKIRLRQPAEGKEDFGKVMGIVMKETKGRADGALVKRIVEASLVDSDNS